MEGGQKHPIPLDSGLDVKSSDQLVTVDRPLFQHNRQRFQGSMLPASLRYEHNGWACGWDVYEFEVDVTSVSTDPEGYTVIKTRLNDNPTYIFQVRSRTTTYVQIWYNAADTDLTGGLDIAHSADYSTVTITGENNGNEFVITINMLDGSISVNDDDMWQIAESSYEDATASSGVTTLNITDLSSKVMFNAAIMEAEDVAYNGESIAEYYSCADGTHVWKDTAGGAWTVECEVSDDSVKRVTVNGDSAEIKSFDEGVLSIGYDGEYSGSVDVSLRGETFYFQLLDIYAKQMSSYIDTSDITSEAFGTWVLNLTGSSYLYPNESDPPSPRAFISGYLPYWSGARIEYAGGVDAEVIDYTLVNAADGYTVNGGNSTFSGEMYFVTDEDVATFYNGSKRGSTGSFWLGEHSCLGKYGTYTSTAKVSYSDIYAKLTYSVCVFNRIEIADASVFPYDVPLRVGIESSSLDTLLNITEDAPWLYKSERANKAGDSITFQSGFYKKVEYYSGESYDAGYYLDGRPDLYPNAYSEDEIIGDSGDYDGYVRLDWPYAYYDIEVQSESWSGISYIGGTADTYKAGCNTIDLCISLSYGEYTVGETNTTYYLGGAGHLYPYYVSTESEYKESATTDTRQMVGITNGTEDSSEDTLTLKLSSGPLSGWSLVLSVATKWVSEYNETDTYLLRDNCVKASASLAEEIATTSDYLNQGYTYSYCSRKHHWVKRDGYGYVGKVTSYFYKLTCTTTLKKDSDTIKSVTVDTQLNLSDYLDYFDVPILSSYFYVSGAGAENTAYAKSNVVAIFAVCLAGYFQSTLSLSNAGKDGVFTSGNLSDCLVLSPSADSYRIQTNAFYIDRDVSGTSFCGIKDIQLSFGTVSISSNVATVYCYIAPVQDSDGEFSSVYVYTGSDSDVYIPGTIYTNTAGAITSGLNLTGKALGTSYNASSLTFYIKGDVAPFYRVLSATLSWIADSGVHDFYQTRLPNAVGALSLGGLTFGDISQSGNGNASAKQYINLLFNGSYIQLCVSFVLSNGNSSTEVTIGNGAGILIDYGVDSFTFNVGSYNWGSTALSIAILATVPLHYDFTTKLPYQYNYKSLSYEDGKYRVDGEGLDYLSIGSFAVSYDSTKQTYTFNTSDIDGKSYSYTYNASTKELTYGTESYDTEKVGDARTAEINALEALKLSFILQGAYKISSKGTLVGFDSKSITFNYDNNDYTFDFTDLMSDTAKNRLAFIYTDTTDDSAVPQSVTFAVQDTTSEYQFLRQAWNTLTEVENYWWIDADTILELNKTSLTVKRKVSSLEDYDSNTDVDVDDWGGDAWKDVYSFDRGDYLDNTVARYGVTCAYGGEEPRFWTVKLASTTSIQINFYTLEKGSTDYSYSLEGLSVSVPVNVVEIGSELNAKSLSLNTYSQLSAETIIYEAKYSGTVIDGYILFGIHLDNNFNQWALAVNIDDEELKFVVQGYGFVGLDGSLTGGEIPSDYFDSSKGFNDTVMPIDTIEQEDVEYVDSMSDFLSLDANGTVVGDESQQWYISKSLSGVVSHLTWNGSSWDTATLPITNTYASCYGSPSYGKRVISDCNFWSQNLSNLISDEGFSEAVDTLTELLTTKVHGYSPKVTTAMYLQQTMGQYAYVHYNSTSPGKQKDLTREDDSENIFGDYGVNGTSYTAIGSARRKKEEPIDAVSPENSDDFSFNMKGVRQSVAVEKPWSGTYGLMMVIMSSLSAITSTLSSVLDTVKVNASEGKVNIGMKGSEMSQIFLQNMANLAITDISVIGVLPALQSAVGSACTLDMFYSTSEGQKVYAGPGWVQHNMVAQCVAQSVTSCQWEMQQIGMLWILDGLSSVTSKLAYEVAKIAWELICEEANATKEGSAAMSNYGWVAAVALIAAGGIAYAACATCKVCAEITDTLVRSICGGSAKVEVQNASSKHTYDVEGKHKYGEKNEIFMWPCFGVNSQNTYNDEVVEAKLTEHNWGLHVPLYSGQSFMGGTSSTLGTMSLEGALGSERQDDDVVSSFDGDVLYQIANCKGKSSTKTLPSDMAVITGADSFLPPVPFRNGNIGVSQPVFPTSCFQDYIIDKDWELSRTAGSGWTTWISCKDTKLIDGDASNIVVSDDFCGVAAPYVAIEVKRGCEQKYIRPWAITPNALALNNTGYNCCYDRKAYHAFDGYGYRIVKWCGASGMNKQGRVFQYSFIVNDRFKRSNKMPLNEFLGNFKGDPVIALRTTGDDEIYNHVTYVGEDARGFEVGVAGEDKDTRRYALPVFSEIVSTLPAVVKTISSSNLSVIDGITSLTTDNRDLQSAYKAPISVDFAIGKDKYRFTEEYISQLEVDPLKGVTTVTDLVPTLGLTYLGSTPYEAYLYSQATRQYYTYSGGTSLEAVDTLERFRDVLFGRYDFVNQEVALPCVATFVRLDKHVFDDDDERDNTIVPRLKGGTFVGEIAPPLETIYNMRSGFKTVSLPSGLCYQGPNRCIINRFVYSDYMKEQIKENYGKWKRVPRERYNPFRDYGVEYERVDENIDSTLVGWTHNPFLLVTSPVGLSSEMDCMFEWEITFAWPVEMDYLYGMGQYAVVNILGECFTPGGKVIPDRPAHVFLWKDLFTRTGNYGYYSFRYQSRGGAGNRERLHIWSDQYIAISGLQVDIKPVTEKRTEVLTQQADVMEMEEI